MSNFTVVILEVNFICLFTFLYTELLTSTKNASVTFDLPYFRHNHLLLFKKFIISSLKSDITQIKSLCDVMDRVKQIPLLKRFSASFLRRKMDETLRRISIR